MSHNRIPKAAADVEHEKLEREELLTLLRDVTEQRDNLLSQYEAMALQVDEFELEKSPPTCWTRGTTPRRPRTVSIARSRKRRTPKSFRASSTKSAARGPRSPRN